MFGMMACARKSWRRVGLRLAARRPGWGRTAALVAVYLLARQRIPIAVHLSRMVPLGFLNMTLTLSFPFTFLVVVN
jgi:hypothetical protein